MGDAGRKGKAKGGSRPDQEELQRSLDRLSLEQALMDAEIANQRVIDLTQQLVEARREIAGLEGPGSFNRMLSSLWRRLVTLIKGTPLEAWARRVRNLLTR